jgi:hypothetical protein
MTWDNCSINGWCVVMMLTQELRDPEAPQVSLTKMT